MHSFYEYFGNADVTVSQSYIFLKSSIIHKLFQVHILSGILSVPPYMLVHTPCYYYHQGHNFRTKFSDNLSHVQMLKWKDVMAHTTHSMVTV
jgi:hypothetical protein